MATQKHLVTDKPCFYCPFRACLACPWQGGGRVTDVGTTRECVKKRAESLNDKEQNDE